MTVLKLYKYLGYNNNLNKELLNPILVQGSFRGEVDDINLIVELENNNNTDFNYVECEALHKYYFVNNITRINNKITRCYLHCDVLMTYKQTILDSFGVCTQGGNINPYYSSIESESRQEIRRVYFPYTFSSSGEYILVTISNNLYNVTAPRTNTATTRALAMMRR